MKNYNITFKLFYKKIFISMTKFRSDPTEQKWMSVEIRQGLVNWYEEWASHFKIAIDETS